MRQRQPRSDAEDEDFADIGKIIVCNGINEQCAGVAPPARYLMKCLGRSQPQPSRRRHTIHPTQNSQRAAPSRTALTQVRTWAPSLNRSVNWIRARSMSPHFRSDSSREASATAGLLHCSSTVVTQRKYCRQECANHGSPELLLSICAILDAALLSPNASPSYQRARSRRRTSWSRSKLLATSFLH